MPEKYLENILVRHFQIHTYSSFTITSPPHLTSYTICSWNSVTM